MRVLDPARHAGSALLAAQSDERLIELVRAGNERAFEAIVNRYQRPLLRHCARVLPAARAEDAVQQTFLKAHTAICDGDADLNLRPWLYRIARNTALNVLRENGWNHEVLDERIDGVERPPEIVERRDRLRATVAAVQRLPGRQRDAIVLRELEGRSYDEIASALTVSDGAVRQLLSRARSSLRAGVSALTPPGLLLRLPGRDPSLVDGATAAAGGAGTLVGMAKLSAGILIGGAAAVGGGVAVLHGSSPHPTPARAAVPAAAASIDPSAPARTAGAPSGASIGRGLASALPVGRPGTSGGAETHGFAFTDGGGGAFASHGDGGGGRSGDGGQRSDGGRSGGSTTADGGGGSTSGDSGSGGGGSTTTDGGGGSSSSDGGGTSSGDGGGQQVTVSSPSGSTSGGGDGSSGGGSGSNDQIGQTTTDGH